MGESVRVARRDEILEILDALRNEAIPDKSDDQG